MRPNRLVAHPRLAQYVAAVELPVVLAIAPLLLFPSRSRVVVAVVVPILWLCAWIAGGRPLPRTPLNAALSLLLTMVVVSLFVTFDVDLSLGKVSGVLLGVLLFWAIVRWVTTPARLKLAVASFVLAGAGLALVALLGTNTARFGPRFPGDPGKVPVLAAIGRSLPAMIRGVPGAEDGFNPNAVAGGLVLFLPLQVALLAGGARRRWITPHVGRRTGTCLAALEPCLLILTVGVFVFMQSRGAFLGLVVATAAFFLWHSRRTRVLVVTATTAVVVWIAVTDLGGLRADGRPATTTSLRSAMTDRLDLWSSGWRGIRDFPLTGMGMNTFRKLMPIRYPTTIKPAEELPHAHNQLIQAALDLGIPGLLAYLALWIITARELASVYRRSTESLYATVASGLGVGLIAHFVFGIGDAIPLGAKVGILFWLTLAMAIALRRIALPSATAD